MPFYMDDLANCIKLHSGKQDQSYGFLRAVMVKEYDPKTNRVKCGHYNPTTREFSMIGNWMPWFTPSNGQGADTESGKLWGQVFTPNIGEWCYMLPFAGSLNAGIVIGGIFTDPRPPPDVDGEFTKSGEWLWFSKDGSYLKFVNGGNVYFKAADNLNAIVDGFANVTILGNCNVTIGGNVVLNVDGDVTGTIGGQMTANVDGDMTATVGGALTASVLGTANVQSGGELQVQSNGNINILSRGLLTLQANEGIFLKSTVAIENIAPIAPISETGGAIVLPLIPLILTPPPEPVKAVDNGTSGIAGGVPVNPTPTPPGPPSPAPGTPLAVQNPRVTDITPTGALLDFDPPAGNSNE